MSTFLMTFPYFLPKVARKSVYKLLKKWTLPFLNKKQKTQGSSRLTRMQRQIKRVKIQ